MDEYIEINYEDVKNDPKKYIGIMIKNNGEVVGTIESRMIGNGRIVYWDNGLMRFAEDISLKIKNPDYKPEVKPETRDDIIKHLDGIIKLLKQA